MTLSQRTRESWVSVRATTSLWSAKLMRTGTRARCVARAAISPATMWRWWYHYLAETHWLEKWGMEGKRERQLQWWRDGELKKQQRLETWNSVWIWTTPWDTKYCSFLCSFSIMSLQSDCHWRWVSKTLSYPEFLPCPLDGLTEPREIIFCIFPKSKKCCFFFKCFFFFLIMMYVCWFCPSSVFFTIM